MTVREALAAGTVKLRGHRCDGADAAREAEALLSFASGLSRERMLMTADAPLPAAARRRFDGLLARRATHAPLAYLLGTAWFAGLEFRVDDRVLIPRPATEHVLEAALAAASRSGARLIIDVGTGSGCIAVAAALALPSAKIVATDDSSSALAIARKNARRHGVAQRIRFLKADLLPGSFERQAPSAKLGARSSELEAPNITVIANLPYVPASARVSPCVHREPRRAVFAPGDGAGPYRKLFRRLAAIPRRAAVTLACELLPGQYAPLAKELRRRFPDARVERIKNHQGKTVGLLAHLEVESG